MKVLFATRWPRRRRDFASHLCLLNRAVSCHALLHRSMVDVRLKSMLNTRSHGQYLSSVTAPASTGLRVDYAEVWSRKDA